MFQYFLLIYILIFIFVDYLVYKYYHKINLLTIIFKNLTTTIVGFFFIYYNIINVNIKLKKNNILDLNYYFKNYINFSFLFINKEYYLQLINYYNDNDNILKLNKNDSIDKVINFIKTISINDFLKFVDSILNYFFINSNNLTSLQTENFEIKYINNTQDKENNNNHYLDKNKLISTIDYLFTSLDNSISTNKNIISISNNKYYILTENEYLSLIKLDDLLTTYLNTKLVHSKTNNQSILINYDYYLTLLDANKIINVIKDCIHNVGDVEKSKFYFENTFFNVIKNSTILNFKKLLFENYNIDDVLYYIDNNNNKRVSVDLDSYDNLINVFYSKITPINYFDNKNNLDKVIVKKIDYEEYLNINLLVNSLNKQIEYFDNKQIEKIILIKNDYLLLKKKLDYLNDLINNQDENYVLINRDNYLKCLDYLNKQDTHMLIEIKNYTDLINKNKDYLAIIDNKKNDELKNLDYKCNKISEILELDDVNLNVTNFENNQTKLIECLNNFIIKQGNECIINSNINIDSILKLQSVAEKINLVCFILNELMNKSKI